MGESLPNHYENHIAGKGDKSLQHYKLVHKFIPMPQTMKIPEAKAAVDKEWEKLEKVLAWDLTKVRSKKEVIDEARTKGAKVHFASQRLKKTLSLEAGRAQLGQAEGAEASFDEYTQEAGVETEHSLILGIFTFEHSGRHGERAERSEFRSSSNKHLRFFACPSKKISNRSLRITCRPASCFT